MIKYVKNDPNLLVVVSKPVVIHESFIEIPGHGKVSASFDFSKLDPAAHEMALGLISTRSIRIHLPIKFDILDEVNSSEMKIVNTFEKDDIGLLGRFFKLIGFYKLFR